MNKSTLKDISRVAALWIVFGLLGEWAVHEMIAHWPLIASRQGIVTSDAIFFLLRVIAPVFVLVVLIIVYSMVRFRTHDDDHRDAPAQYRHGKAFALGWVSLSVVLNVLFIIHPGITGLAALWGYSQAAQAKTDPLTVNVTAKQWEWDFAYPAYHIKDVDKLVVPVNKPVKFILRSADVVHSFWVPAWGIKRAVIPGETRTLVVTPDMVTSTKVDPTVRVQCAQICGVGHAFMRADLRVVSASNFKRWTTHRKKQGMGGMKSMGGMSGMKMSGKQKNDTGMGNMNGGKDKQTMHGMDDTGAAGGSQPMDHMGDMNKGSASGQRGNHGANGNGGAQ